VKAAGGDAVAYPPDVQSAPTNGTFPARAAAKYPAYTAIGLGIGTPDYTSGDGQTYYYIAPATVNGFIVNDGLVTQASIDAGTNALIPQWWKDIEAGGKKLLIFGGIGLGVVAVIAIATRKKNPPRRRRR
jgi:hypothetical protein